MRVNTPIILSTVLILAGCSMHTQSAIGATATDPIRKLTGEWQGTCRSVVSWYNQDIHINLMIKADAKVAGRVGDAVLRQAHLKQKQGIFARFLNKKNNNFRIDAELEGAIVEKENIVRKKIIILLKLEDNTLLGGFTTSGTTFGGKSSMKMTAYKMKLERVDAIVAKV